MKRQSIFPPGLVALAFVLALVALQIAIMVEVAVLLLLSIAGVAATRANCVKRHIGAVITVNRQIVSTGYNGTAKGTRNCDEGGCPRCLSFVDSGSKLDECLCVHAEENAIIQAALHGISIEGSTLYCTHQPCILCAKMMINAQVKRAVYARSYPDGTALQFLQQAGIEVARL